MIRPLKEIEREYILQALVYFRGSRTYAAKALGMSLRTLRFKIAQYRDEGHWVPDYSNSNRNRSSYEQRNREV